MFKDTDGTVIGIGEVWLHEDATTGNISVALVLPLALKDSTYGTNSSDYNSDPNKFKAQKFKDLTGSDKAIFVMKDTNGAVVNLNPPGTGGIGLDFLHGFTDSTLSMESKDDGPFFASGFTGFEGSDVAPLPPPGVSAATSMGFNFNTVNAASNPNRTDELAVHFGTGSSSPGSGDTAFSSWDFTHTYEFQVTAAAFGDGGINITSMSAVAAQLLLAEIHLSPKAIKFDKIGTMIGAPLPTPDPNPVGTVVPEPEGMTLALMGFAGLLAAGWFSRKKRNIEATV